MSEAVQNSLAAEADAARERIAERLETLQDRLEPKKLVRETVEQARDAARSEIRHAAGAARMEIRHAADATTDFLRENAAIIGAVAAAGVGLALAVNMPKRKARRRGTTTPLYDAYSMEDPTMHDQSNESRPGGIRDSAGDFRARAGEKLGGVKHRAADAYGSARDRAAGAYGSARERAASARQRVGETAEEYATRAREEAAQAAAWARRQPSENPMGTTVAAFALGALIGAVLPRSRAENRAMGQTKSRLVEGVKTQADAALEAGKDALADAGITTEAAKAKLSELTEDAKHVAKDVAGAAAAKVKVPGVGGTGGGDTGGGMGGSGSTGGMGGSTSPTPSGTPGPAFTSGSAPVGGGTTQSGSTTDSASGYGTTPPAAGSPLGTAL